MIVVLIVTSIYIMYLMNKEYNIKQERIRELEKKLNEYYMERERRLTERMRESENASNRKH